MELVALDGSCESASLRFADHLDLVAVREDIDLNLIADIRFRLLCETDFLEDFRRRNTAAGLLEVTSERFRNVLGLDGFVLNESKLDRVVSITT